MATFEGLAATQIDWLTDKASLTQRLRAFTHNKISHHLFYDDWGVTDQNEEAWIRRMEWQHFDETWIASVVIIPETSITAETNELLHVGERSIGDILFKDPTLTRSDFTFSKIENNEWSRQSTFYFKNKPIFILEHFFPEFFRAIQCAQK